MDRRERLYSEYMEDLQAAHVCAQRALNALYKADGPKRGIFHRMKLGRAQNALISLYIKEISREEK